MFLKVLKRIRWVWVWAAVTAAYRNRVEIMRLLDRASGAIGARRERPPRS